MNKSELFAQYNRMKAQIKRESGEKGTARVNRALGILQTKSEYYNEDKQYSPTAWSCGCKDWEFHMAGKRGYNGPCKHMLAEQIKLGF